MEPFGLDLRSSSPTPMASNYKGQEGDKLNPERAAIFRTVLGRLLYYSRLRQDIGYATKELARWTKEPCESEWTACKRLCRYVIATRDMETVIEADGDENDLTAISDASWGSRTHTRRSTTGGVVRWAGGVLLAWSRTQKSVTQSSAEAELVALVDAVNEVKAVRQIITEILGISPVSDGLLGRDGCRGRCTTTRGRKATTR